MPRAVQAGEEDALSRTVWSYRLPNFSEEAYQVAVNDLIRHYERVSGFFLQPKKTGKIGIKISTSFGLGLSTPKALTKAVISNLEKKGYKRKDIFIFDEREYDLRRAGYLPPLSIFRAENSFEGATVVAFDKTKPWDPEWFYTCPLPSKEKMLGLIDRNVYLYGSFMEDRKSFLPVSLLFDVDCWINLPVVSSDHVIEVRGALANLSLSNISNNSRFWDNRHHANVAMAEIAAIPELQESLAFTILSLERYQFIGGPIFNAYYTDSEAVVWLSKNPVALDFAFVQKINQDRGRYQLPPIPEEPEFIKFAKQVGVGDYKNIKWVKLP